MIEFEPHEALQLYQQQDFAELSRRFLAIFDKLRATRELRLDPQSVDWSKLNQFVATFLDLFVQPDYRIPRELVPNFILHNVTISELISLTPFQTADAFLSMLLKQTENLDRFLTLYSARCKSRFESELFYTVDPTNTSLWWYQFASSYAGGLVSIEVCRHLRWHFAQMNDRLQLHSGVHHVYYGCTYFDGEHDRDLKAKLNDLVTRNFGPIDLRGRPNPRKIAVISDCWFTRHSVHRTLADYVRRLRPEFHVTGICVELEREKFDVSMFDSVLRLDSVDGKVNLDPLAGNDFAAVYFPDVGMKTPSVILSNLRIAPLQLMGTGHPVSTWGGQIDWFVGGQSTDKPDHPETNYTERLLLLPGYGAIHEAPRYERKRPEKRTDRIIINCSATIQKINPKVMAAWRRVVDRLGNRVVFRLFGATDAVPVSDLPILNRLRLVLGNASCLELVPGLEYEFYMQAMEEGDFACDSFHFGGSNSVADLLYLRKPVVCLEGHYWYNRIGPAMLRDIGLGELVVQNEDQYVDKICRLVEDVPYRHDVTRRLEAADLSADIFSTKHADSFRESLKFLIDNQTAGNLDRLPNPLIGKSHL